ncbi:MAG: hypothetical protein EA344_09880 [Alkalicoccus sp.]|nr:MAG: hypothetical protein EA344_09880 [Alkalicoccus sp.]
MALLKLHFDRRGACGSFFFAPSLPGRNGVSSDHQHISFLVCFRRRLLVKPTLPTCEACSGQLTWTQSLRAQRFFYEYTYCPYCREKQYINTHKKHLSVILLAAVSPLIINLFIDLSIVSSLALYAVIITIGFVVTPFAYSLKSKDPILAKRGNSA